MVTDKSTGWIHADADTVPHSPFRDQLDKRFESALKATKSEIKFDKRFDKVEASLDRLEIKFDKAEASLDRLDTKFDKAEASFERLDTKFDGLATKFDANFDLFNKRFSVIESKLESTAEKIIRSQNYNESELLLTVFFAVSHVLIFTIFYVLI